MKSLGYYNDLYLKTDVFLLTDVFEKLINWSQKYYRLDPCHKFGSPELNWETVLKMSGIEL